MNRLLLLLAVFVTASGCGVMPRPLPADERWNGMCARVGLDATLAGDPSDPRMAWLIESNGLRRDVIWPPGYTARFTPLLEVLDAKGGVVVRDGSPVSGGCASGEDGKGPLLIAPGI